MIGSIAESARGARGRRRGPFYPAARRKFLKSDHRVRHLPDRHAAAWGPGVGSRWAELAGGCSNVHGAAAGAAFQSTGGGDLSTSTGDGRISVRLHRAAGRDGPSLGPRTSSSTPSVRDRPSPRHRDATVGVDQGRSRRCNCNREPLDALDVNVHPTRRSALLEQSLMHQVSARVGDALGQGPAPALSSRTASPWRIQWGRRAHSRRTAGGISEPVAPGRHVTQTRTGTRDSVLLMSQCRHLPSTALGNSTS